ncbi:MAG TPA: HAD-IA family hydrolase [Solirubrobacteraceae bacterium]
MVLLDALGTLLELTPPAPRLRRELAARFGVEVSLAEAEVAVAAEIAYYRAHLDEGRDGRSLASLRGRCARALRHALPEVARPRLPDGVEMVDALLASLRFDAFPDALETLPRLRREGRRLVVVSNWDVSLHEVLERVGLAGLLDGVVTSAEAEARKPDPAIFELALALAGASTGEAIHIGDSLIEDVAGAQAAGIEPILLLRGGGPPPPGVRTISTLGELA